MIRYKGKVVPDLKKFAKQMSKDVDIYLMEVRNFLCKMSSCSDVSCGSCIYNEKNLKVLGSRLLETKGEIFDIIRDAIFK